MKGIGASRMLAMIGAVSGLLGAAAAGFKNKFVAGPRNIYVEPKPSRRNSWAAHAARQNAKREYRDARLGKYFRQYRKRYAGY